MTLRTLLFFNASSGSGNKDTLREHLVTTLVPEKVIEVSETEAEEWKNDLQGDWDRVAVCGGDGTIQGVAELIYNLERDLPIGIFPGGSANGMAAELGIETVEDALAAWEQGEVQPWDVVQLNGKHHSLHLADLGLNARLVRRFEADNIRGMWGYYRQVWREGWPPKASRMVIRSQGKVLSRHRLLMLVIANGRQYGNGAIVNEQGQPGDGQVELILVRPFPWHSLLRAIGAAMLGRLSQTPYVETHRVTEAQVTNPAALDLQVDGEPAGQPESVTIKVLERKVQFFGLERA
jgi:diacylglycerol kinase (ATP)